MFKPINTAEAMKAYRNYERAQRDYSSALHYKSQSTDLDALKATTEAAYTAAKDAASAAISERLDAAQSAARVRTISAIDIIMALAEITDKLNISKKAMEGITADVDLHAQTFPGRYNGIPESTHFCAEYKRGNWRVTNISRSRTRSSSQRIIVNHTEASRAAILDRLSHW